MKRLFTAIPVHLTDESRQTIKLIQWEMRDDKIKWVHLDNTHLTLKFFGETPENRIDDICEALYDATIGTEPFTLRMERLGIFGSRYKPKVIWLGFEENQEIIRLQKNILKELEKIDVYEDRQNFVPHLTIGRIKFIKHKRFFQETIDKYKDVFSQGNDINAFHLFESILKPTGPQYEIIESFSLR